MATINLTTLTSQADKEGRIPVLIRISCKNNRAYIRTEFYIDDIAEWEDGKVVYRKDAKIMNKRLEYVFNRYKERFDSIEGIDYFTAVQIKQIISDVERPSFVSFLEFWQKRIDEIRKEGRESYAKMNEETFRVFKLAEGDIPVPALTPSLVEHFRKWMVKRGYSMGNIGIRLSHLKARVNELIRDGALRADVHPFQLTKVPTAEPKDCDMSISDFNKVRFANLEGKRMNLGRDLFLLSFYLGGMNLKDLLSVNLSKDTIVYKRTKVSTTVKSTVTIPVHPKAREIIDRYIGRSGRLELGYNYTYANMQKYINLCIRTMKNYLGIERTLCFYSARKTFAQFASEIGISDSIIDYCLGHSDRSRGIIRYYTKIREKQAAAAINRVIDYVDNPDAYRDMLEVREDMIAVMMR